MNAAMRMTTEGALAIGLSLGAAAASSQSLAQRVTRAQDGTVRMSFTARSGVCGNGTNIMTMRDTEHWESACEAGPVRVVLDVARGTVTGLHTYVGGRWRPAGPAVTDLGTVGAPEAAAYMLSLAARLDGKAGADAILPATLADSVTVWPELLAIAKDASRPRETRRAAVFWVGQAAGARASEGLEGLVDAPGDREVREHAVFALSQLPNDEGVPVLIRLARTHEDPRIRKRAMFWLGQSNDPRAIALFEEILLRP